MFLSLSQRLPLMFPLFSANPFFNLHLVQNNLYVAKKSINGIFCNKNMMFSCTYSPKELRIELLTTQQQQQKTCCYLFNGSQGIACNLSMVIKTGFFHPDSSSEYNVTTQCIMAYSIHLL